MQGSVTISIDLFDKLRDAEGKAKENETSIKLAAKELEVFLSFMCTREHIQEYLDEFNRQSKKSRILLEDGRAKIIFKDDSNNNS